MNTCQKYQTRTKIPLTRKTLVNKVHTKMKDENLENDLNIQ